MKTLVVFLATLTAFRNDKVQGQEFKCTIPNLRCELPFEYEGRTFDACTSYKIEDQNRTWCPTKVYDDGTMDAFYCGRCFGEQRCYFTGDSFSDSSWLITCPPGCYYVQKITYGTNNQFATNSYICASALHEGLISNDTGGVISVVKQNWQDDFLAVKKNEIKTYEAKNENFKRMLVRRNARVAAAPQMVFTNGKSMISTMNRGSTTMSPAIITGQSLASDVVCDVRKRKIFWTDPLQPAIFSATFDGNRAINQRKILQNAKILYPEMLAVDWVHGNLYWTDSKMNSVGVSDFNGQNIVILIERDDGFVPKGIAVDPNTGHFYVVDAGDRPKIEKCVSHERDSCETIVRTGDNLVAPSSLAIDTDRNRLCWVDSGIPRISCIKLNGPTRYDMKLSKERLAIPHDIALANGKVFWTDTGKTIIASADLDTWNSFHIHLGDVEHANGLTMFDAQSQQIYQDKCRDAPCKYLCVPKAGGYACLCKKGEFLQGDGSCGLHQARLDIYVAESTAISRYTVNPDTSALISKKTIRTGLRAVKTVAIDTQKKMIYWADKSENNIDMAPLSDNLIKKNFLNAASGYVSDVEGIAIDSITRLFYWSDTKLHAVYVTNLDLDADGQHHVTALVEGDDNYKPIGIALDPRHGYIYIADSASPYKIQVCESKGGIGCQNLIENNLNQPNWITVDFAAKRLIFTNYQKNEILSTNYEGEDRKQIRPRTPIYLPHGVGVYNDKVYWTEPILRRINSMDKTTGSGKALIATATTRAYGFALYNENNPNPDAYPNVCARKNCQYLCVPIPKDQNSASALCLCPDKERGKNNLEECRISCEEGYEPSPRDGTCIDINECTPKHNNGNCDKNEKCQNTIGSYMCTEELSPCQNNPCENGGLCEETADKLDYNCECVEGFKGKDCETLDVRLEETKDEETGAIYLRCIVPPGVQSEIVWTLNRDGIHTSDRSFSLSLDYKMLAIHRPHYTHSGIFACQFTFKNIERVARTTLIIKEKPQIACGESPGIEIDERVSGPKILGGTETKIKFAPWVAMLYKDKDGIAVKKGVFCGGSLIDTRHVVTAAHCFLKVSFKEIEVYVGKLQTDVKVLEKYQQKSKVKNLIEHPLFHPDTLNGDLAILVLEDEIYFTSAVMPICIGHPKKDDDNDEIQSRAPKKGKKKYGIVYGWGLTEQGVYSKRLLEIILPIVKDSICENSHGSSRITKTMFCVGGEAERDACEGDSGGPFTLWSQSKRKWYLAGVVSWGFKCGRSDKPGVYTRISKPIRKWIYENSDLTLD